MMLPIPTDELRAISRRSNGPGLRRLAVHLGSIAAAAAAVLAARATLWIWPAMVALGLLEVTLFAPHHEATHETPFRSRWPMRLVGLVAGFLLLLPPKLFRAFHIAHHRYAQDPARDPELLGTMPLTRRLYAWRLTGIPYWIWNVRKLFAIAAGRADDPWIAPEARGSIEREARGFLAAYAAIFAGAIALRSPLPLLLWVVPVVIAQPALRYLLLAEHTGCPLGADPWTNTRTTLASAPVRYLFWNMSYHAEHHLVPAVPFHALPALHAKVGKRFATVDPGYPAAHRGIRAAISRLATCAGAREDPSRCG